MKFGLWVEPERVALSTLDQPGLAQLMRDGIELGHGAVSRAVVVVLSQVFLKRDVVSGFSRTNPRRSVRP
jgi:hypothetical protein